MTNEELDWLIEAWVMHRLGEYRDISWPRETVLAKMMKSQAAGTRHFTINENLPDYLEFICNAIMSLSQIQREVIKAEYEDGRPQRKKARKLGIKLHNYRKYLCTARQSIKNYK